MEYVVLDFKLSKLANLTQPVLRRSMDYLMNLKKKK